jgi:L-2,4-diaminobutyrate decarboxylase
LFESEFLIPSEESNDRYQRLISQAAEIICTSLPDATYHGKDARALASLVCTDFLPETPCSSEQIAATLRTVVSNSVSVTHPNTAAHLHCPPLLSALAAEVVMNPTVTETQMEGLIRKVTDQGGGIESSR